MKPKTRMISLILALAMTLSMAITAFAAGDGGDTPDFPTDGVIPPDWTEEIDDPNADKETDSSTEPDVGQETNQETDPSADPDSGEEDNAAPSDTNDTDFPDDDPNAAENDGYADPDADVEANTDVIWNFTGADENLNELDEDNALPLVTKFSDVKSTAWYYNDVTECAKLGIVSGFEDGSFRPEDKVTGIQFIVMLTRTFYNELVESAKKTDNSTWYAPNVAAAKNANILNKVTVEDKAMNRFNMAAALYNILKKENKLNDATTAKLQAVKTALKDYSNLKYNGVSYLTQVKYCHALGIIQGMSDGTFAGTQSMTRAQACTVIMRMLKVVKEYNPGDKDNTQYDDGKNQNTGNTGNNNQNTNTNTGSDNGTLANGKAATVANVQAVLDQLKRQYPAGSTWDTNTRYNNASTEVGATFSLIYATERTGGSCNMGCGGYAAMISDAIFGHNAGREVTDITKVRPGDIIFKQDKNGVSKHIAIVTKTIAPGQPGNANTDRWVVCCTDGNNNSQVSWATEYGVMGCGKSNPTPNIGIYYRFATRY